MAIDLNDEILQDFLVEAGEIHEQLNEQMVELELNPDDDDLLNSIFRGFHTIKGGGSFLALDNLVAVCHKSEDVFNLLRNHELRLDANMMDVFLRVLDDVGKMFDEIRNGIDPSPADPDVIVKLQAMEEGDDEAEEEDAVGEGDQQQATDDEHSLDAAPEEGEEESVAAASDVPAQDDSATKASAMKEFVAGNDDITDDEFESLLDALQGDDKDKDNSTEGAASKSKQADSSDGGSISDSEFDALLNNEEPVANTATKQPEKKSAAKNTKTKKSSANKKSDDITDDEFEAMLDNMHGKGKGPKAKTVKASDTKPADTKPIETNKNETNKSDIKASAAKVPVAKPPSAVEKPEAIAPVKPQPVVKPVAETTVRVDTARLDDIMNLVGELVLTRNRLNTLKDTFEDERMHEAIANLDVVTGDLQTVVMKTRMQPVKKVFGRFPRVVRDLARTLKKEIKLELMGEETDLDKNLVEALADPLVHLVRNSVDHGIEMPDIREAAGKPREGVVVLAAKQEGDHIILSISDDGAGMDPDVLRNKVIEKGLMDAESAARLDDKGCFDLIFMPGLTTKDQISNVSGRGVGMDVVKTKISQLNGSIEILSELGKGTVLNIKVPLTLAILPTLMVQLGSRKFALPLSNVSEIFELSSKKTSIVDGREVVLNRGTAPPVFYLRDWLLNGSAAKEPKAEDPQVIMVQVSNTIVGLVVDQVIGQEEVVIKPLGALLHGLPGMAGSTITGDGNIAIILDVQGLLNNYA